MEMTWGLCDSYSSRRVSRVAHTPQELDELLRLKATAERSAFPGGYFSDSCQKGVWIPHRGHFARVLMPRTAPGCAGKKCPPIHPPHPLWVRAGGKVGIVPRHPDDVKGKPPINLKYGILVPPAKPGELVRRIPL